jgi:hypothetical protein
MNLVYPDHILINIFNLSLFWLFWFKPVIMRFIPEIVDTFVAYENIVSVSELLC